MKSRSIRGGLMVVALGAIISIGATSHDSTLPKTEAANLAKRVRKLMPEGWTVTSRGDDIVIERSKPVQFARMEINAPAVVDKTAIRANDLLESQYRLTLHFARKMSLEEFENLAAINAASAKERDRLAAQTGLTQKFGDFIATTQEEKERLTAYRKAEAKLVWHILPDLYTPDHSIHLLQSWSAWLYLYDKDVARECQDVRDVILKYFGMYDLDAAAGRIDPGSHES